MVALTGKLRATPIRFVKDSLVNQSINQSINQSVNHY